MQIEIKDLMYHPFDRYNPNGYQKFECMGMRISLEKALTKLGMSLSQLGKFNFGEDPDYRKCLLAWRDCQWEENYDEQFPGLSGWLGSWFWVPGNTTLPPSSPVNEGKLIGPIKKEEPPSAKNAKAMASTFAPRPEKFYAARSQSDGVWATATIDCGIEAGDILFSHHAPDDFISKMTMSWMTHAGIAVNATMAVDADNRDDGEAVAPISLEEFFQQGKPPDYGPGGHVTPTGGLVYRYKGKPGDPPKAAEDIRYKAAIWAVSQISNQWKFSLEHSPIIDTKKEKGKIVEVYHDRDSDKKIRIVEKNFDAEGKAVDSKGKRLQYWSRSDGKYTDTPFQTIYCAELVWRAYRAAGVNVVDPKKFFNLYEDDNRAIAGLLWFKIEPERDTLAYLQGSDGHGRSDTAETIRRGFTGVKGKAARMLPNSVLRKQVLGYMKAKNSGFLCAPYQLAESSLCKRFAQLDFVNDKFKEIELADFHNANLNPLEVVDTLCKGKTEAEYQKAWQDFIDKKAKKVKVSAQKPWPDCNHKAASKLVTTSKDYNKPVDFSAASQKPPFMT